MRIFITGMPGIGKTTLILKTAEELKKRGYRIGGMVTQELREHGKRVGFRVKALDTDEEGVLAIIGEGSPRIGRYVVNIHDLERVGVNAIRRAVRNAQIIIIDEMGAMEFKSKEFEKAVEEAINSRKPLLAVVHRRYVDKFRKFGIVYTLTHENQEKMQEKILETLSKSIDRYT